MECFVNLRAFIFVKTLSLMRKLWLLTPLGVLMLEVEGGGE
jgi:hypothetical protein